jgi:hypothetical protein
MEPFGALANDLSNNDDSASKLEFREEEDDETDVGEEEAEEANPPN